ncbi:YopX family protein [Lactiplantibacillus pentosus]|uniref:YopX family protein n=1 Tax=Lactiplantibacillus pentosus TaxID=1589 RepID=UPI0020793AC8|nr:YopX family protein [Lactiplantibacillus pentosus]USJ86886.1 YopX family protein [Lactiplantibacillus pentosus]
MIKFRAWNGYRKMMADYVSALQNGDTQGTPSSVNVIVNGENETWDIKNDRVELLQFTGLKDVNGRDIYEGDILKTKAGLIQIVEQGILETDREDIISGFYANNLSDDKPHTFSYDDEVIGNVHANPELLEADK